MRRAIVVPILLALAAPAHALLFEDGGVHVVTEDVLGKEGSVTVRDGPGDDPTEVTVQAFVEGSIGVTQHSVVVVDGGSSGGSVYALDDATLSVVHADVGNDIYATGSAQGTAEDVDVENNVFANDDAFLALQDVRIGSALETGDIFVNDDAHIVAGGGTTVHDNVFANGTGWLELEDVAIGGWLHANAQSEVDLSGGSVAEELESHGTATLRVFGSDFEVDGAPVPFGPLAATSGTLTGTLADGSPLANVFAREAGATILLVAVPEPGSLLLWAAGGALLLGAGRRRAPDRPGAYSARTSAVSKAAWKR